MFERWKWGVALETPWGRFVGSIGEGQLTLSVTRDLGVGYPSRWSHLWALSIGWGWPWWRCMSEDVDFST